MNKIIKITAVLFILSFGNIFALGNRQTGYTIPPSHLYDDHDETSEQTRAEEVMKALHEAYPRQIDRVEFRNNDWAVLLRGTWYYYAEGRLLPENLRRETASYSSMQFYRYSAELPPWRAPTPEQEARYQNMMENRGRNPPRRASFFLDNLWRARDRDEMNQRLQTFRFLRNTIYVHYLILENLSLVEEQILAAAGRDPVVQEWIDNISSVEAWYWRNIAESRSRSYHSYGLAIDILPRALGTRETYWIWASEKRPDWWNVSYNERYHPPAAVIRAFETYGFIWGGKWVLFDTMHFEYRPEILILNGMRPETRR
jgi:hypothetical protein